MFSWITSQRRYAYAIVKMLLLLILFDASLLSPAAGATHFRGGTASWKPSPNFSEDVKEIQIEYQIGWRISFNANIMCDDDIIRNKVVNPGIGAWRSEEGPVADAQYVCAEYDTLDDWMIGYNRIYYNVTTENVTIWYEGRCWISNLFYDGCDWSLSFMVNVGVRSDTGLPNSSPKSASPPVIRMQAGCPTMIEIPTTDPDGDKVTCRFGNTYRECGEVCQHFPFFSIDEETCKLTYNGGGVPSTVTVAIIIEDHPTVSISIADGSGDGLSVAQDEVLSYIPLQFLVLLASSDIPCNARPSFTENSPPNGQVVTTVTGAVFEFAVYSRPSVETENITDVRFVYPFGASKSNIVELEDKVFRINVTWIPTLEQVGSEIFCFSARDSLGLLSVQRCITVIVGGASSPCSINNGGCSDRCTVVSGTNYDCDCPRPCWYLADDGRTCYPKLEVECHAHTMDVIIPTCATDNPSVTIGVSSSEQCNVVSDDQFHNFSIPFSECQIQVQETFWEIKYSNAVRLWANNGIDPETQNNNSVITRGAWYYVPISCSFLKFGDLTTSFQPVDREITLLDVPGLGSFSFFLDFYNGSTFDQAIGPYDYPLSFTVNSDIYFGVHAVGGGRDMQIFTVSCIAYQSEDVDSETSSYTMISEGCIRDTTMQQYNSLSPMENHFSIRAFRFRDSFPASDGPTIVNIRCSVMVCTDGPQITRCSQGCTDVKRRRRRNLFKQQQRYKRQTDLDEDTEVDQTNVTETPIQQVTSSGDIKIVVDITVPTEPVADNSGESSSIVMLVAAGVVGIALLLIITICMIVVYHNKLVRSRNMIMPDQTAYVRDVFLPNIDLNFNNVNEQSIRKQINSPANEFVWAQRVINGPPDSLIRFSTYRNNW